MGLISGEAPAGCVLTEGGVHVKSFTKHAGGDVSPLQWEERSKSMEIEGYQFPDDLYYHKEHYWARIEKDAVVMGATDFAQKLAGEITYVELPEEGRKLEQGRPCGSMETGKWVGRIYAVVSGSVVEANQDLEDTPELINESPYEAGWICKIKPSNLDQELKTLLPINALPAFIRSEIARVETITSKES
jgi:glycine cleavage system H protein